MEKLFTNNMLTSTGITFHEQRHRSLGRCHTLEVSQKFRKIGIGSIIIE